MAFISRVLYSGDGATLPFTFNVPYIAASHVEVYVDSVLQTITTDYSFTTATQITFVVAPPSGTNNILLKRKTPTGRLINYVDGANLTEAKLDKDGNQLSYIVEETVDDLLAKLGLDTGETYWDADSKQLKNLTDPTASQDAASKAYVDAVATGTLVTPLPVASGGTGAASASAARTSLALYSTTEIDAAVAAVLAGLVDLSGVTDAVASRIALEVDRPVQTKSATYAQAATDKNNMIRWTAAGSYTLLAAATAGSDFQVDIMANGGAVTIDPDGAELVNGAATLVVADGTSGTLFCDATGWYFLAGGGGGGSYRGENGNVAPVNVGDIFRVHEQTLNTDVTIAATENAICAGPLTVASTVTLTVASGGNLVVA